LATSVPLSARELAISMLTATLVRKAEDAAVQRILSWVSDTGRPRWQTEALLRGAEAGLSIGGLPGNARRGAAPTITSTAVNTPGAPCATCPGGRAGPGGAYAFQDARGRRGSAARGGGGRGGPRLQVTREPDTLAAMAAGGGDFAARATNLLARLDWPGKPGAAAPVAALTADEQQRFDAGREVYRNVCQACHQPDGRGLERVAPALVGSPLTLAPPDIAARVLLNGKEGPIGLMPPLGMTMTDEQIASALTYIRREWGHTGAPVDAALVGATRAQTASRRRPWTHDELLAMMPGRGN
jgi:mono/diheme cytochrome c family protein